MNGQSAIFRRVLPGSLEPVEEKDRVVSGARARDATVHGVEDGDNRVRDTDGSGREYDSSPEG